LQRAVHHPHQGDHADIVVEPGIDDERLQRAVRVALRRRNPFDQLFEELRDTEPGLGADQRGVVGRDADDFLDLVNHLRGVGGRKIDLVDDRQHLQPLLERGVAVCDALGLHTLRGIDHQQRAFAGRERSGHLIGEVHVSGRVDEVELILLAALRLEAECDALCLDGDAPLTLQVHRVEDLRLHLASLEPSALLDEPVGQRRLAVIDMGDDGEIADVLH
jgi:hypothetical protein